MPKTNKIEKEFFDKLAEILEKEFPKNQCQERGHALALNAFANLYFRELNKKAIQEVLGELEPKKRVLTKELKESLTTLGIAYENGRKREQDILKAKITNLRV